MKKCPRCKVVFLLAERLRCLYCDTLLVSTEFDDPDNQLNFQAQEPVIQEVIKRYRLMGEGRMQYILGSYFRTRAFYFMYLFSRNEFKRGKEFKRLLVQPLNASSFLMVPWVLINILDSVYMRIVYTGYDEACGWKFKRVSDGQTIDPDERDYNIEYNSILDEILSGRITRSEIRLKRQSLKKIAAGKRSAYHDLCLVRSGSYKFFDIACVWISICIWLYLLTVLLLPFLRQGAGKLAGET